MRPTHPTLDPLPRSWTHTDSSSCSDNSGVQFLEMKMKSRRSQGLGIQAPKDDIHTSRRLINMQITH